MTYVKKSHTKAYLALLLAIILIVAAGATAWAVLSVPKPPTVGVKAGDTFTYGIKGMVNLFAEDAVPTEGFDNYNQTDYFKVTVTDVTGTNVTTHSVWRFLNGTELTYDENFDVTTGKEGLVFWAIYPADLNIGDLLRPNGYDETTVNNTYSRTYTSGGFEVPGPYPTFINAIGNGIIYTVTSEHTFQTPIYKGALARAINATDGSEIWTLSAATGEFIGESYAIADGYSVFFNSYDARIYSVGKGPSQTSVMVGPKSSTFGGAVVIEGTVTDISAGTNQNEPAMRFPDGVPVSSDKSMKDWMGYVYQQQPIPSNFTGVDITLSVMDANGNYRTIGTATTDETGYYSYVWTPDISGKYQLYASFAGTNGYWPSNKQTTFNIVDVAATPEPEPTQPPSAADTYFMPAFAGLFAAIIVVIVLVLLLMRKK